MTHFTDTELPAVTLVLGGARSGKSTFAERMVADHGSAIYLATARPEDEEMRVRIERHRNRRGAGWATVEEPLDLPGALRLHARGERAVLVDCLTLWLSNLMLADRDLEHETGRLIDVLSHLSAPVVFVSNELGMGLVPETALGRAFRDHAGTLNQSIAMAADRVVFIAAGLPLTLKDIH